ncbi:MAG TPA: aminoglycoside 6'-N-acetyltransferase [Candidatus Kapabacteria bacterium]|nr:aminoglycoside 6'-N-acetyltransferase [Candidatus Kapabacteria bacterium]
MPGNFYSDMTEADLSASLALAEALWPEEDAEDLRQHFSSILHNDRWRTILCKTGSGEVIAFANLSIHYEYVEGSESSPVGYIEGIYVKPEYRKQGIAKELVRLGEEWSRSRGCTEYASDTEFHNKESQAFHRAIGFDREETIVHFIKNIS